MCPVLAWGSQLVFAAIPHDARVRGCVWLPLTAAQGALLIIGLYCGGKVLALERSSIQPPTWRAALLGAGLSAGTIVLIVALSLGGA